MSTAVTDTPIMDLIGDMTAASLEASTLDGPTLALVRIAALVAVDAPPASYLLNLGVARELGIGADDVKAVVAAVAPIVGTPRVVSAAGNIARALGFAIELEELEERDAERVVGTAGPGAHQHPVPRLCPRRSFAAASTSPEGCLPSRGTVGRTRGLPVRTTPPGLQRLNGCSRLAESHPDPTGGASSRTTSSRPH